MAPEDDCAPDNRGKVMGDIADYLMDSYEHWRGSDYDDDPYGYYEKKAVKCRRCGSVDVYWHQHKNGSWCLFDTKTQKGHVCSQTRKSIKEKVNWIQTVKVCGNCESYFIQGKCITHDFETGAFSVCDDWDEK